MSYRYLPRLSAAILMFTLAPVAPADEVLEEIIVTADFRGRTITELPSSVSIIDADTIENAAIQHFEELVQVVPNLNWSGDGHRARYFQIRGVGELEQYQGAPNPSVGFIIDDIDFSGIGSVATLFDMQSVEVLRGSQGSRYGANALGGLIYLRSADPSADRNGRLQLTAGEDDAMSYALAFGGALNKAETTTFRLSAQSYESNGFRDNSFLNRNDTNGRNEASARVRLRLAPHDGLSANFALLWTDIDNGYDAFSLDNTYTVLSDKPGKDGQESIGASMRFDWYPSDSTTLTSITALANSNIEFSFDADWGNDTSWAPVTYDYISLSARDRQTISQEFRVTADGWLTGLYVQNLDERLETLNLGDYYDPLYDFSDSLQYPFNSAYDATSVAAFVQIDRDVASRTRVSAGLRVEHRNTDYSDSDGLLAGPSETMWGGELSLNHEIGNDAAAFVTVSKGFKAGGFNLGLVPSGEREFGAEEMWTIEAGIKSSFYDDALQLNASVFHSHRIDQQVRVSTQLDPGDPASFVFFTDNTGDGKTTGIETELRWRATDSVELYANIGLLDAELFSGRDQAHAPAYTFAGGVVYRRPEGFFARLDVSAKDVFYFDVSHDQRSTAYELVNARAGYEGESWRVAVWARNVGDKQYAVRGFFFGNEPPDFPDSLYTRLGDRRQLGVTIERRFF
ncbi:MAG: TonB-dependent receptor [Gammaproteobacteria bacterium]|nr:TonB-dependent receptor [Gammaproteobacteria bacterium]